MEIEMFFAKYDVDGDGEFSMEEGGKLIEDLDNDRIDNMVLIIKVSVADNKYHLHWKGERPKTGVRPGTGMARPLTAQSNINHEEFGMYEKSLTHYL